MSEHRSFKKSAAAAAVATLLAGMATNNAMAQAAATDAEGIPEVMVTAQRVSTSASKTPISLTVLSGDELKQAGAVNAASLTELVPSVQIANIGGASVISIRGISSTDNTEKGDPAASFNIDGVNLARPQSAGVAFYDLERVEVLRGPQGTLYGRNSTAGAINLITNKPVNTFAASGAVELGNYHSRKVDAMINVPVNDVLALRAAVSTNEHDGYLRSTQGYAHDYDDDNSKSARFHALFKFNPDMSLLLTADATRLRAVGAGSIPYAIFSTRSGDAQRTASPGIEGFTNDDSRGFAAEFNAKTRFGDFTYQFAHRSLDRDDDIQNGQAVAGTISPDSRLIGTYKQNSHEVRLASTFGNLKTIGGLFWFKEDSKVFSAIYHYANVGTIAVNQDPVLSESKAAFGEATYAVTPALNLTAGLRRTLDEKSRKGLTETGTPITSTVVNDAAVSYGQTTGRLGADYALSKSTMLYATFSTGYKAGGFNDGNAGTNAFLTYDPEHLNAFETGVKGRFFANKLQISADVFRYDYKNLQLTAPAVNPATGSVSTQTLNAAKAKVNGAELEGKYAIGMDDKINFSATWLDATFDSYKPTATANWSGKSLEKSPRATVYLGYSHTWGLDSGATLTGHVGSRYSSSYVLNDYKNALQFTQGGFHKSDVNFNYTPANAAWSLQAFVRNIEDKTVMMGYAVASGARPAAATLAAPRTMGLRLSANF